MEQDVLLLLLHPPAFSFGWGQTGIGEKLSHHCSVVHLLDCSFYSPFGGWLDAMNERKMFGAEYRLYLYSHLQNSLFVCCP